MSDVTELYRCDSCGTNCTRIEYGWQCPRCGSTFYPLPESGYRVQIVPPQGEHEVTMDDGSTCTVIHHGGGILRTPYDEARSAARAALGNPVIIGGEAVMYPYAGGAPDA